MKQLTIDFGCDSLFPDGDCPDIDHTRIRPEYMVSLFALLDAADETPDRVVRPSPLPGRRHWTDAETEWAEQCAALQADGWLDVLEWEWEPKRAKPGWPRSVQVAGADRIRAILRGEYRNPVCADRKPKSAARRSRRSGAAAGVGGHPHRSGRAEKIDRNC